ncbi:beta-lactamase family protein [Nocardioides dongxiaopingii]|uniref:serine hydrolase domain-containing protein n=1 Tax=Nocardioides sp. S-1144 TaxID=2582905 RepID=UPI0011626840|nr:serine hydrolase domain-containing protein [Nocardioides sp. S-1144]QDH10910.1 beta-lactamase family protein [Nocardioides sp. S-1144]
MSLGVRLAALQRRGRLPSVVGGVLRDGALVESAGVHADPSTAYRIGSITKTMTAALILQLRDEGALALDDPVGRLLPGVGYADLTIADLLGHTGGMQSEPAGPWWERSTGGDFEALVAANDGTGAVAGPGEWFHYSNLGYGLLGEVVARLRGAPWWDVVAARLLEPLAMTRTTYGPDAERGPHAQGHSVEHFTGRLALEPHTDTGAMAPAGQAWSTVADLAVWAAFLAGRRPDVLAAATLAEMGAPRLDPSYGLGLRVLDLGPDGARRFVGHTGSMPGFLASLFVEPASGDGAVVLANATTGLDADGVPHDLLLAEEPAPVEPWVPTTSVPPSVEPLLGTWFWGNSAVELRWSSDRLEVRSLQSGSLAHTFELRDDATIVGVSGYHRGETLHVHPTHLECATFVYTRVPYDPAAPIPGR